MEKISAVYQIVNEVTGDSYVGSSKNVKQRWAQHKRLSLQKQQPNSPLYKDMQKYGVDKFRFQILAPVMEEYLTQVEQEFIELLNPTYNRQRAKGWDTERFKVAKRKCSRKYSKSDKFKIANRRYKQSEKGKETYRKYNSQSCFYNGEKLTLRALASRFARAGIEHPVVEAKKYLINN